MPTYARLSYSTDGGTTWLPSTPVDLRLSVYACTITPERVLERTYQANYRMEVVDKGRVKLALTIDRDVFFDDTTSALLVFAQDWLRKPLLRVFLHTGDGSTGVTVDGRTYFATSNNTNYVIPESGLEPDIEGDRIKSLTMTLRMRDVVA